MFHSAPTLNRNQLLFPLLSLLHHFRSGHITRSAYVHSLRTCVRPTSDQPMWVHRGRTCTSDSEFRILCGPLVKQSALLLNYFTCYIKLLMKRLDVMWKVLLVVSGLQTLLLSTPFPAVAVRLWLLNKGLSGSLISALVISLMCVKFLCDSWEVWTDGFGWKTHHACNISVL